MNETVEKIEKEIRNIITIKSRKGYRVDDNNIICDTCDQSAKISDYISEIFKWDIIFCRYCKIKFVAKSVIKDLNVSEFEYLAYIKRHIISLDMKTVATTRRYLTSKRRLESEQQKYSQKWVGKLFSSSYCAKQVKEKSAEKKRIERSKIDLITLKNSIETPINSSFDLYRRNIIKSFNVTSSLLNSAEEKYLNSYKERDPYKIFSNIVVFDDLLRAKIPKCISLDTRIDYVKNHISKEDYEKMLFDNYLFVYNIKTYFINYLACFVNQSCCPIIFCTITK